MPFLFTDMPYKNITANFSNRYPGFVEPMLSAGIIERDDWYSTDKKKSKKYRISPAYFEKEDEQEHFSIETKAEKMTVRQEKEQNYWQTNFSNDMDSLNIDYERLNQLKDELVSLVSIDNYQLNEDITFDGACPTTYYSTKFENHYVCTISKSRETAKKNKKDLIKTDKGAVIANRDAFVQYKKNHYRTAIRK